jgi:polyhydroxybutyrate depolymerase
MKLTSIMASTALLLAACSMKAPTPLPPARSVVSTKILGTDRSYILRFPKAYDGKAKLPMVMLIHGATDSAAYAEAAYHFDEKAEKEGFILVLPDALGAVHAWNSSGNGDDTTQDETFLTTLLESLPKNYAIDAKRVYVCGHSSGAIMTYRLAGDHPELISAIGIVAGLISDFPPPRGPIPIVAFHGKLDTVLPYDSLPEAMAYWAKLNHCPEKPSRSETLVPHVTRDVYAPVGAGGAEMVAYTLDDGNHMWPGGNIMPGKSMQPVQEISATDIMWDFFNAHPRK